MCYCAATLAPVGWMMHTWTADWWIWLLLGLLLAGLELITPGGLYLLFFGIAAVLVGLLSAMSLVQPLWLQVLLFTVLALLALGLFRRALLAKLRRDAPDSVVDGLVGQTAVALEDIPGNGEGRVELRGSAWHARNVGDLHLSVGQGGTVERVDGLTLWVHGSGAGERAQPEVPLRTGEERELL
jgi:membrane protein implicated in regulation of membrane protease activity